MGNPYAAVRDRLLALAATDQAPSDLRRYLNRPGGGQFERLLDHDSPNGFTSADFQALRKLSVSALYSARERLCGTDRETVGKLLKDIPEDRDIWEIAPEEYASVLGPGSPAWRLWRHIFQLQAGARRAGRDVTTGKMMHGKRPRLIPIFNHRVKAALGIPGDHFWEAIWHVMRDPAVRDVLYHVQEQVSKASGLSLLRVLDIVVWMSGEKKQDRQPGLLSVRDVPSAECDLESVLIGQTLEAAQVLMNANEYSQLAVVSETGELEGAVSWKSIARARFVNEHPTLRDAMFRCTTVRPNDELLPLIDTIYKEEFMLVKDTSDKPRGIVTAADLAAQFRELTSAFFQISDIEARLRYRINDSFTPDELIATTRLESAEDMTFGQYLRLLEDADNWEKMRWLQADQTTFLDCLDRARCVRNKVMHSTGELSEDEKLELGQLFNLMRTLTPLPEYAD